MLLVLVEGGAAGVAAAAAEAAAALLMAFLAVAAKEVVLGCSLARAFSCNGGCVEGAKKRGGQAVRRRARARVANGAAATALARTSTSPSASRATTMMTARWQGRRLGLILAADGLHNEEQEEG